MKEVTKVLDASRIGLGRGFAFEASHKLIGYEGKCSSLHGHSYHGRVLVSVPRERAEVSGIVLDFDVLKTAITVNIMRYDHKHMNDFFTTPTAEHMVPMMALNLQEWFEVNEGNTLHTAEGHERRVPTGIKVERVVLYETANCFAEWHRGGF